MAVTDERPLSAREVGELLRLSRDVVKGIPAADLPYFTANERGDRRYRPEDVRAYIERRSVRG
jgi:hypothetical protein